MCARKMVITDMSKLRKVFGVTYGATPNFAPRYNLPITEREPIVRLDGEKRRTLELATWDYRDDTVKTLKGRAPFYNARGESMAQSSVFAQRRCLVPVDGFYEWMTVNSKKQPFVFRRKDKEPFAMAGVWSEWTNPEGGETLLTYVELTVPSSPLVAEIHNRMPLIISQGNWQTYLEGSPAAARELVESNPMNEFMRYAVSMKVNNVRNEGPQLIEPIEADDRAPQLDL